MRFFVRFIGHCTDPVGGILSTHRRGSLSDRIGK
jgi:hypothetical protein